jgi:putative tryptophan/tyrosine transport system substrate-binding protein
MVACATAWPFAGRAQQTGMSVIGVVHPASGWLPDQLEAFRGGLAEAGYVESKNLVIESRFADFKPELISKAAGDLVRLNVKAIFAVGPEALAAARKATDSIPIVAVDLETDPVEKGYIKNLARPGGNVTGMFLDIPELSAKQVELLAQVVPRLSRIAIFGDPHINVAQFAAMERATRAFKLEAESLEVLVPDDIERALTTATMKHSEAGVLLTSPLVYNYMKQIGSLAISKRLPLISVFAEFPKEGGFMAYGPSILEFFQGCGEYVGKILSGTAPNDLPIRRPVRFELAINLKTAQALGVIVPPLLLATASAVIE